MIHIIGDIHQPLHTSALFSAEFPKGDLGGNLFEIIYLKKKSYKELHEFWDAIVDQFSSIQVPLTEASYQKLQGYAQNLTAEYPRSSLVSELNKKTVDEWVNEGGEKARTSAYWNQKIKSGDTLSDQYVTQGQNMARKQLALGGYRLADWLMEIYGKKLDFE